MKEKLYYIYMYTSPSGKKYVGQTKHLTKRINAHKNMKSGCRAFINAIKKYGYDNFILDILIEDISLYEANELEKYYIEFYNSLSPNGYNIQIGGLNHTPTKDTLELQRLAKLGEKNYWYNKNHSEEAKKKMSESKLGELHNMYGKHQTEESNEKRKASLLGELNHQYGLVGKLNPNSKSYIITFPDGREEFIVGLADFSRKNNLNKSTMSQVAKCKIKKHKGFKCRYATEQEILDNFPNP